MDVARGACHIHARPGPRRPTPSSRRPLTRALRAARRLYAKDDAIAASEYALLLGLVALLLLFVLTVFGSHLRAQWQRVDAVFQPPACTNSNGSAPTQNPNCQ